MSLKVDTKGCHKLIAKMPALMKIFLPQGVPCGSDSKESDSNAGDPGLMPGWRRSPQEGKGYPLQYSCLGNPMDKGAWQAIVHGVGKTNTIMSSLKIKKKLKKKRVRHD